MGEGQGLRLWKWRYTDESGKRRTTRYLLSEDEAKAKRSGKDRSLAGDQDANGIDQRLSKIAEEVLAGKHYECAWELFRVQYFPGLEHAILGAWSTRHGVRVTFEKRTVREMPVIFVCIGV
jgi:hypothetical protein